MSLEAKNLIGYSKKAGTKAASQAINPATNQILEPVYYGVDDADFDKSTSLAWSAFLIYRQFSDSERANFLDTIATEIEATAAQIVERAMLETGLPQIRLQGECVRTCNQLRLFSNVLRSGDYQDIRVDKAIPDRQPMPRPDIRYRKIALGPVAVFGASNFPLAFSVAGGDTASALAAGCPVIVKAHNAHPGTSELVGNAIIKAAKKCNMPEGIFSLLYGVGNDIGQKLAAHPNIKAIGFTGSRTGGMSLVKTAQAREEPIPVYAEMSSINPVYIMSNALAQKGESIGKSLVTSMVMGAGQFCTSPGLILVIEGEGLDTFIQSVKTAISEQTTQTMLTPTIASSFDKGIEQLSKHAQLLANGKTGVQVNQCRAHIFMVEGDHFANNKNLTTEVFGSSAVIVRCRDFAQMQALTEQLEGQLTAAIHATENDNREQLKLLLTQLERKAGRILFNGFGTGVEVCNAMVHGGPFPATSNSRSTSVGATAIDRFLRPVCYQDIPFDLLPAVLQDN